MNRYRISARFKIFDTTNNGDLEEIYISDPPFLVSPKPDGTNSRKHHVDAKLRGLVSAENKQDNNEEEEKRKPAKVVLEIDAPDFEQAKHRGFDEIAVRADLLAAFTSGSVKIVGGMTCQEITPDKAETVAEIQSEAVMSVAKLDMKYIERIMAGDLPTGLPSEPVLRSMRWFRNGLASILPEDMFFCFWIALEAVGGEFTKDVKKYMRCPRCGRKFEECPECKKNTDVPAPANEGIRALLKGYVKDEKEEFLELNKLRAKLLHGNVQITEKLRNELMSKLGIMQSAIYRAYECLLGFEQGKFPYSNRPMFGQTSLILTIGKKTDNELAK